MSSSIAVRHCDITHHSDSKDKHTHTHTPVKKQSQDCIHDQGAGRLLLQALNMMTFPPDCHQMSNTFVKQTVPTRTDSTDCCLWSASLSNCRRCAGLSCNLILLFVTLQCLNRVFSQVKMCGVQGVLNRLQTIHNQIINGSFLGRIYGLYVFILVFLCSNCFINWKSMLHFVKLKVWFKKTNKKTKQEGTKEKNIMLTADIGHFWYFFIIVLFLIFNRTGSLFLM